jgi:hypothetical protein
MQLPCEPVVYKKLFTSDMKTRAPLLIVASLALAFTGCSKPSPTASLPKNNDFGVIHVSSGQPSSHTLADGRACTITPTILPDGNVSLTTRIDEAKGFKTLTFETPIDGKAYTFAFDQNTSITVTLLQ